MGQAGARGGRVNLRERNRPDSGFRLEEWRGPARDDRTAPWRAAPGKFEEVAVLAEQFDIVVLGGGPAGYATALYGAAAGLNIALGRGGPGRRDVPPPGLHPGQGAPPDGRGPAHDPAGARLRRRRRRADARPRPLAGPQAGGHRPPDQGPRVAPQGPQGHRLQLAGRGRRRRRAHGAPRRRHRGAGRPTS